MAMVKMNYSAAAKTTAPQQLKGTITRVSSNSVVYVTLDDSQRNVSFTPKVVQGYGGQELGSFGLVPGSRVDIQEWDARTGAVGCVTLSEPQQKQGFWKLHFGP